MVFFHFYDIFCGWGQVFLVMRRWELGWDSGGQDPRIPGCGWESRVSIGEKGQRQGSPPKGTGSLAGIKPLSFYVKSAPRLPSASCFPIMPYIYLPCTLVPASPLQWLNFKPTFPVSVKAFCLGHNIWYLPASHWGTAGQTHPCSWTPSAWQGSVRNCAGWNKPLLPRRWLKTETYPSLSEEQQVVSHCPKHQGRTRFP